MMAANYRHIGGLENRLGRHYSRFSASGPAAPLAAQSLARRKSPNHGSNRRSQARAFLVIQPLGEILLRTCCRWRRRTSAVTSFNCSRRPSSAPRRAICDHSPGWLGLKSPEEVDHRDVDLRGALLLCPVAAARQYDRAAQLRREVGKIG